MEFINTQHQSIPKTEIKLIDWNDQVHNNEEIDEVVTLWFGAEQFEHLYPCFPEDVSVVYKLLELTDYTGRVCNMSQLEFRLKYPKTED